MPPLYQGNAKVAAAPKVRRVRLPKRQWPGDSPFWWLAAGRDGDGLGGHDLAGLTGADTRALLAIAACWDLLPTCDDRANVLEAVGWLLGTMQKKFHPLARELIAKSLDWSERDRLWEEMRALTSGRFDP